jgi:hypothetical protein
MSNISITINAETAGEAMIHVRALAGLAGNGDTIDNTVRDSKPAAVEVKPAEKTKATATKKTTAAPEIEVIPAEAVETTETVTRADLTQTIKNLHASKGDEVLPKVKQVLADFGAAKQSEVTDENIAAVVAKLKAL